jgi:hypothetical protein
MIPKPLIPSFHLITSDDFSDFYAIIAKNVEDSLITSGATPGKDYTILDLYKLAQPFVLQCWRQPDKKPLEITRRWSQKESEPSSSAQPNPPSSHPGNLGTSSAAGTITAPPMGKKP